MKKTINSHASVKISLADSAIYFDPFGIRDEPHDAQLVFITHSHFDHYSPEDIQKVIKKDTVFIIPRSMENELNAFSGYETVTLAPGETKTVKGIEITGVAAYNTNKPMHKKEYGWLGYVVTVENERIYVCGDTDITPEAKSVKCDIVFVPAGGTYTTTYAEAAELVNIIKPVTAIPYHYGAIVGDREYGQLFKKLVDPEITVEILI